MRKILTLAALIGGIVIYIPARGADAPASKPATTAPAAVGKVVEATDVDALKALDGKEATVHGKVSGTFKSSRSGILLINFEGAGRNFVALVEKDNLDAVNAGFGGDVAVALKGKSVTIIGPIKMYKEKPEVVISKPEQINVEADEEKPADEQKKEGEKKEEKQGDRQ